MDLSNICRFCMCDFRKLFDVTEDIKVLFECCMRATLKEKPGTKVCKRCYSRLKEFKSFKLMCLESEFRLEFPEVQQQNESVPVEEEHDEQEQLCHGNLIQTSGGNLVKIIDSDDEEQEAVKVQVIADENDVDTPVDYEDFIALSPGQSESLLEDLQCDENDVQMVEFIEDNSGQLLTQIFDPQPSQEIIIVTNVPVENEDDVEVEIPDNEDEWEEDIPDEQAPETVSYEGLIVNPDPEIIEKIRQERALTRKIKRKYPYKSKRKPKTCQICSKSIAANVFLVHLLCHKDPSEYTDEDKAKYDKHYCEFCNSFYINLPDHKELIHTEKLVVACNICRMAMKREMLAMHMQTHIDAFKCDACDKTFQTKQQIQAHNEAVHAEDKFFCSNCQRSFVSSTMLATHVQEVHDRRSFICEDCGKVFATKSNLNSHRYKGMYASCLEDSNPSKPGQKKQFLAVCVCGEKANSMAQFARHLDVHKLDDNRIHCVICERSYAYKRPFMFHMVKDHGTDSFS